MRNLTGLHWAKIKVSGGLCVFWRLQGGTLFPGLFQNLEAACTPWLVALSILKASLLSLFHDATCLVLTLLLPSSQFKDTCNYAGPTGIISLLEGQLIIETSIPSAT